MPPFLSSPNLNFLKSITFSPQNLIFFHRHANPKRLLLRSIPSPLSPDCSSSLPITAAARSPALMGLRSLRASFAAAAVAGDGYTRKVVNGGRNGGAAEGINGKGRKEEEEKETRLMTLPTVLTLARVAAVPLLVSTFYMDGRWATTATTSIFVGAAVTDWLDGYIARKMKLKTTFGAFLDPVADKLMVAATLVLLCTKPLDVATIGEAPWLLAMPSIAIIGREITMSAVREWAASQNSKLLEAVAVNNLGKWKTATQMTALTILLATRDPSLTGAGGLVASGVLLLYISAGLAILSLIVYMRKIWRILLM